MAGKRLTSLEMPEDDATLEPAAVSPERDPALRTIVLPPIPPARRREIMVQLSIKVPLHLVERLEKLNSSTWRAKAANHRRRTRRISQRTWVLRLRPCVQPPSRPCYRQVCADCQPINRPGSGG